MAQDELIAARSITVDKQTINVNGQSITAGGQTITAGGQSITAGGQTITAGGQSITAGGQTVTGGATIDTLSGGVPAVQTVATGGTIAVTGARVIRATVSAGATASNLSLGSGLSGQEINVINENATGGSTLGITGSVSAATSISGLSAKKFIWDPSQTAWVNPS